MSSSHFYLSSVSHFLSAALILLSVLKMILHLLSLVSDVSARHLQLSVTNLWCQKKMNWQNSQLLNWRLLSYYFKSLQWSFSLLLTIIIFLFHCLHLFILMHLLLLWSLSVLLSLCILFLHCLENELLLL